MTQIKYFKAPIDYDRKWHKINYPKWALPNTSSDEDNMIKDRNQHHHVYLTNKSRLRKSLDPVIARHKPEEPTKTQTQNPNYETTYLTSAASSTHKPVLKSRKSLPSWTKPSTESSLPKTQSHETYEEVDFTKIDNPFRISSNVGIRKSFRRSCRRKNPNTDRSKSTDIDHLNISSTTPVPKPRKSLQNSNSCEEAVYCPPEPINYSKNAKDKNVPMIPIRHTSIRKPLTNITDLWQKPKQQHQQLTSTEKSTSPSFDSGIKNLKSPAIITTRFNKPSPSKIAQQIPTPSRSQVQQPTLPHPSQPSSTIDDFPLGHDFHQQNLQILKNNLYKNFPPESVSKIARTYEKDNKPPIWYDDETSLRNPIQIFKRHLNSTELDIHNKVMEELGQMVFV